MAAELAEPKMRVVGNNLLVRLLPKAKRSRGGLHLLEDNSTSLLAIGKIIGVGHLTGDKVHTHVAIPGLSVGDHVAFLRVHEKMDSNRYVAQVLGDSVIRVRPADVLLVLDESDLKRLQ